MMPSSPPLTLRIYFGLSWLLGWWLMFDGLHASVWGDYIRIAGQLGPWAEMARAVGLDPLSFATFFIALGAAFISTSFGLYLRQSWAYGVALVASAIGVLYLLFGTPLALVCLVVLLLPPTRAYLKKPAT